MKILSLIRKVLFKLLYWRKIYHKIKWISVGYFKDIIATLVS